MASAELDDSLRQRLAADFGACAASAHGAWATVIDEVVHRHHVDWHLVFLSATGDRSEASPVEGCLVMALSLTASREADDLTVHLSCEGPEGESEQEMRYRFDGATLTELGSVVR